MSRPIEIVEVGPRDGLQNEATPLSVAQRLDLIGRLQACGARRIEAVSFVNPTRVPQMAGAEEIMAALPPGAFSRIGLVLNMRGWDRCVAAGCDEANIVVCATDGFGIRNQGASAKEQVEAMAAIAAKQKAEGGPPLSMTVSVAFGCPFEGEVDEGRVIDIVEQAADLGIGEIALADTIGVADPWKVRRMMGEARNVAPKARLRMHFHDTRNTGLANAAAAVDAGVDVLDASVGGLGGCPFAPASTVNLATEDLVYMLQRAGFETGLDLDRLIDTGRWITGVLGKAPPSALDRAGVFPAHA
ncbi:MAG: pyruvate carboxyltransferase [Caulobacteraceae bacterium]|nr:pyruvate carboxyltransferase [Caulobacteraceae bacterium]